MNTTKWIARLSAYAVLLLAIGGFILSYSALYAVALSSGVPVKLAFIWPLLIDLALVIFSLAVVRAALLGERQWWPWALVVLFTIGTIVFNIVHAGENVTTLFGIPLKYLVGVVPPVALVLGFETFMGMVRGSVQRQRLVENMDNLRAELASLQTTKDDLQASIDNETGQLRGQLDNLRGEIGQHQQTIDQLKTAIEQKKAELDRTGQETIRAYIPDNLTPEDRQRIVHQMVNDELTIGTMASLLRVSEGTIKNDKRAIKASENGNG